MLGKLIQINEINGKMLCVICTVILRHGYYTENELSEGERVCIAFFFVIIIHIHRVTHVGMLREYELKIKHVIRTSIGI